jgi:hypothetical protein
MARQADLVRDQPQRLSVGFIQIIVGQRHEQFHRIDLQALHPAWMQT